MKKKKLKMHNQKMNKPFLFWKSVVSTDRLLLELPAMINAMFTVVLRKWISIFLC